MNKYFNILPTEIISIIFNYVHDKLYILIQYQKYIICNPVIIGLFYNNNNALKYKKRYINNTYFSKYKIIISHNNNINLKNAILNNYNSIYISLYYNYYFIDNITIYYDIFCPNINNYSYIDTLKFSFNKQNILWRKFKHSKLNNKYYPKMSIIQNEDKFINKILYFIENENYIINSAKLIQ